MDLLKKLFAGVASLAVVATTVAPLATMAKTVPGEYQTAYDYAKTNGLTSMPTFEGFNFYGSLNREAGARFFVKSLEAATTPEVVHSESACQFDDLSAGDSTLTDFVVKACQYGLMGIDSNTNQPSNNFNPKGKMTRGQTLTVISRMLDGDKFNGGTPYWKNHEANLFDKGVVTKLHPEANANGPALRGYTVIMLQRAADKVDNNTCAADEMYVQGEGCVANAAICQDEETLSMLESIGMTADDLGCGDATDTTDNVDDTDNTDNTDNSVVKEGTLEISKGAGTILKDGSAVPQKGTVTLMEVQLKAGSTDIDVNSISLKKLGLGNNNGISRVYFEDANGARISSRSSLRNDGTATVSLSPKLPVKANSTESVYLVVELDDSAGSHHSFKIEQIDSSAKDVLGLGLMSPEIQTANYDVLSLGYDAISTDTSYTDGNYTHLKLGQFKVENTYDTDDKTALVKSLTFKNSGNGDASTSLDNIVIERDGKVVSDEVTFAGRDMTVSFKDQTIAPNKIAVYTLYADVNYVDNDPADTYKFTLLKNDDVNIVEESTMFRSSFATGSNDVLSNGNINMDLATVTVNGGDVILRNAENFDRTQTVVLGAQDLAIMDGTIVAKKEITIEDHTGVSLTMKTNANADVDLATAKSIINNIDLSIGDEIINGTIAGSAGALTVTFDGTFDINGSEPVKVLVDLNTSANDYSNYTIQLGSLDLDQFTTKTYVSNDNNVTSTIGSLASATFTIDTSRLSAQRTDGFGSIEKVVEGDTNVKLIEATLSNDSSIDVNLTSLTFDTSKVVSGDDSSYDGTLSTFVYIDDALKTQDNATPKTPTGETPNTTLDYNGFSINVPANGSVKVRIMADLESSKTGDFALNLTDFLATDVNGTVYDSSNSTDVIGLKSVDFDISTSSASIIVKKETNDYAQLLSPSSTGDAIIGTFQVEAYDDDVNLDTVYIMATGSDVTGSLEKHISSLSLYRQDGTFVANGVFKDNILAVTGGVETGANITTGTLDGFEFKNISTNNTVVDGTIETFVVKAILNDITATGDTAKDIQLFIPKYVNLDEAVDTNSAGLIIQQSNGTAVTNPDNTFAADNTLAISQTNTLVNTYPVVAQGAATNGTLKVMDFDVTPIGSKVVLSGVTLSMSMGGNSGNIIIYKDGVAGDIVWSGAYTGIVLHEVNNSGTALELTQKATFTVELQTALSNGQSYTARLSDIEYVDTAKGETGNTVSIAPYRNASQDLPITTNFSVAQ